MIINLERNFHPLGHAVSGHRTLCRWHNFNHLRPEAHIKSFRLNKEKLARPSDAVSTNIYGIGTPIPYKNYKVVTTL